MKKVLVCICLVATCFGIGYYYGASKQDFPTILTPNAPFTPVTTQTFVFSDNNEYTIERINPVISLSQTTDISQTYLMMKVFGTCDAIEIYSTEADQEVLLETFEPDPSGCGDELVVSLFEGQFPNQQLTLKSDSDFDAVVYLAAAGGDQ
ncbi:hypothetical protein RZE82_05310 [Mollicutes bacterium LVI A0039]|nr:hypothetical protein RZE82_05310 [Mollicutes bacterium LVI A0039]